jgi:hypothetical protein
MHFPHALLPAKSYEEDIAVFDQLLGTIDSEFSADLFITADHGQSRGEKGEHSYGFSVYEGSAQIPLITPRLSRGERVEFPVGARQLASIIIRRDVEQEKFIYCDTQYYKQLDRVFMIRSDNYKYIYNKRGNTEELYDLTFDPDEHINLLKRYYYCPHRRIHYPYEELFWYPFWEQAERYFITLKAEKERIWRTGSFINKVIEFLREVKNRYRLEALCMKWKIKRFSLGRWGSSVR